jgi:NitT/TauT family transport system ATP-binding protein
MSARPGRVQRIVEVDLAYPRTTETREEARFFELATEVRELLRESHEGRDVAREAEA